MNEAALAVVHSEPVAIETAGALMKRADDVAAVCKHVVTRLAVHIHNKRYLPVEAWNTIAAAYGCAPSIREVVEEERGVRAVAELRRHDGQIIASAEGFCGLDEPKWATSPMYARRAMAQTRAISRVCRTAFAFVVSLMDAGLETTPLDEVPHAGFEPSPEPAKRAASAPVAAQVNGAAPVRSKDTTVKFGKSKGKFLCDIDEADLRWQLAAAQKSVDANDPKWGEANKKWLATVQAEVSRRGL